jgi:CRISPR-associated protein Csx14
MMKNAPKGTVIATLGVEPQVVTIALDNLLGKYNIGELAVIHTNQADVLYGLQLIENEFDKGFYPDIALKKVIVKNIEDPITDFTTKESLQCLLKTLYAEFRRVREKDIPLHLCLTGGRKVMSIFSMVTAQLLFGPDDHAWYLLTEGWKPGQKRKLHLPKKDKIWLLSVPVLCWQEAGTLMQTVAELNDPAEVVNWYDRLIKKGQLKQKSHFVKYWLTPAEREVVNLVCRGMDNTFIASHLHKSEQTVANQLGNVYEKLREWLNYPDKVIERSVLIAEFAPYYAMIDLINEER